MKLFLPGEKLLNLKQFALGIIFQVPIARSVTSFHGLCQPTMPAIPETPLHIRALQRDLIKALAPQRSHASYKIRLTLSQKAINILQWWIDSAHLSNGGDTIPPPVDTMFFCNASKIRWGAHLDSILIGRRWYKKEASSQINFSGTKSSIPSISCSRSISQGAPHLFRHKQLHGHVSYQQAGGHSVSNTVKSSNRIMELCPEQKPDNFSHSPSREAECPGRSQSRIFKYSIEWMLNSSIFRGVVARLGRPDMDLFASRVNHQILEFVSW